MLTKAKLLRMPAKKYMAKEKLEIFSDQKIAKKVCLTNQKLIKIPNPKVLEIASQKLKEKGITRIIYEDNLLSL